MFEVVEEPSFMKLHCVEFMNSHPPLFMILPSLLVFLFHFICSLPISSFFIPFPFNSCSTIMLCCMHPFMFYKTSTLLSYQFFALLKEDLSLCLTYSHIFSHIRNYIHNVLHSLILSWQHNYAVH